MTDGQRDLFGFLGAAFAVLVGLFVLQELYGSFIDVQAHASLADAAMFPELAAARDAEAKKLAAGRLPIEQAMRGLAERGRAGFRSVAPAPSDDLSAMTGWIHRHHFQAYVPNAQPVAVAPEPVPEAAPEAASEDALEVVPEAAPAPEAVRAPKAAPAVRAPKTGAPAATEPARKEPE